MRELSAMSLLLFATFATAGLGTGLTEDAKLSLSNIMPALFVLFGTLPFLAGRRHVRKDVIGLLLFFNISCALSFLVFLVRFGWSPNFPVLFFQDVEIVFCILLVLHARQSWDEFEAVVRAGVYAAAFVALFSGWREHNDPNDFVRFGMDDKSQGSVFLCCLAYLLIRFFRKPLDCALGLGLFVVSFLTVSRLPVLFAPAIMSALIGRSRFGRVLGPALVAGLATTLVVYGDAVAKVFVVLDRLSSVQQVSGSDSTFAHLLLVQIAAAIKFSDPWALVLGIGPGNFSKALVTFAPPQTAEIARVDPLLMADAALGRAPLHSAVMQMLLDYNIVVFVILLYALSHAAIYLIRRRIYMDSLFFLCLLLAASFYSLHNKPYFFLLTTTIALFAVQRARALQGSDQGAVEVGRARSGLRAAGPS